MPSSGVTSSPHDAYMYITIPIICIMTGIAIILCLASDTNIDEHKNH